MPQELPVRILLNAIQWFGESPLRNLVRPLQLVLRHYGLPEPVEHLSAHFDQLKNAVDVLYQQATQAAHPLAELRKHLALDEQREPILKRVLLGFRRHLAAETEQILARVHHAATRDRIVSDLRALDQFLPEMMASGDPPLLIPSLFDFISIQDAALYLPEGQQQPVAQQPQRAYDEKFHILQAPALFLPDLQYYRSVCELRRVPCSVAFIDIDDFKKFNSEVTETEVDRSVLPLFMRTLEAHFFSNGHVYRQGGDEYLAILPAMSRRFAIEYFDELRGQLGALNYPTTNRKTTVSIGLCVAEPDCLLTDRELQQRANRAKEHAKAAGKNCISTFKGDVSYSTDLDRVRPVS